MNNIIEDLKKPLSDAIALLKSNEGNIEYSEFKTIETQLLVFMVFVEECTHKLKSGEKVSEDYLREKSAQINEYVDLLAELF